jgi:DNA-binding winged helix-turn-helix (wHTH) protein
VNSNRLRLPPDEPHATCEFGEFQLDTRRRSLLRAGQPIPVNHRALDTLICLVRHRGTLVTREALIDSIWPDAEVEANNLSQVVKQLRRSLGERPGENRYIETVHGRGYRFVANLRVSAGTWGGDSTDARPTHDAQAYEHYRQALRLIQRPTAENCARAVELLQAALTRDAQFARAWAWLADAQLFAVNLGHSPPEALALAEEHAHRALQLDSGIAQAHTVLGTSSAQRGDWLLAESHFHKAMSLDPSDAKARSLHASMLLEQVGHIGRALQELRDAYAMIPDDPRMLVNLAMAHSVAGLDDEALRCATLATAFGFPETSLPLPVVYAHAAMRSGRFADAAQRARRLLPDGLRAAEAIELTYKALESARYREDAVNALRRLIEHAPAPLLSRSGVAVVLMEWCTQLGQLDLAFRVGDRALDSLSAARPPSWQSLWAPELLPLRQDDRFRSLASRLAFNSYWRAHGPPDCPSARRVVGLS